MTTRVTGGPRVEGGTVFFRLPDEAGELDSVRLYQEISRPRLGPAFEFDDASRSWTLEFPRPRALRMEYLLEVRRAGDAAGLMPDPHNERRAPGPFGDKSEILLDGYERPEWLEEEAEPGLVRRLEVRCRPFHARLPVLVWAPPGSDPSERLPLLLVHDGPEFAEYARLTTFLEVMTGRQRIPRMRAAMIGPVDRDHSYSASAAYTRSLAHQIMPELMRAAPVPHGRSARMGMGASLGALAMLHLHRREPASLGGVFLMSGSYFRKRYDPQEAHFVRFGRISRFVGEVLTAETWGHPIPMKMTCGTVEENLSNNRALRTALLKQGYDVPLHENPDGHNWTAWRDVFDPHLTDFIGDNWG